MEEAYQKKARIVLEKVIRIDADEDRVERLANLFWHNDRHIMLQAIEMFKDTLKKKIDEESQ